MTGLSVHEEKNWPDRRSIEKKMMKKLVLKKFCIYPSIWTKGKQCPRYCTIIHAFSKSLSIEN
jgi:hypothetical protein